MPQHLIIYASFGVAAIVACESIPATTTRQRTKERFEFLDLIAMLIEKPGAVSIHERYPQVRLRRQNQRQWFQVKAAVYKKLSICKLRWQIELTPNTSAAAGENRFGSGLVPCSPAASSRMRCRSLRALPFRPF